MKTRLYIKIVAMLAAIAVVSLGATALFRSIPWQHDADEMTVVTSFYPVYIAAKNVVGDTAGVRVVNMVDSQGGCLHDYQMSPRDRAVLESADVFVMNGAGAEPFLTAALASLPSLQVVDLSTGQLLLESGHVHEHDHEHDGDEHDEASVNGHLWVSPLRYRQQVALLGESLAKADPANAAHYRENAAAYIEKIDAVWARMKAAATPFADTPTVLFHDSLLYLAEDLGLTVVASLNVGEESGVSASDKAAATDALLGKETALFLYDSQYATTVGGLTQGVGRVVELSVDTAVSGADTPDAWLDAMTSICENWEAQYA
ncbi:MAG: zinc ABC transporter substrate-binding protein [Clostridia bacterium]|nr:zinc ABC transporter substrate-binding protein [Clostridia bacterium]